MTTLHRGPRNSNPLEAVAKRRHAELDAQFDLALDCAPPAGSFLLRPAFAWRQPGADARRDTFATQEERDCA